MDEGCWGHGTVGAGGCNKLCPHPLLAAPSPLSLTCCSGSVSSFSVPLSGVAQQQPNADSCGPHWEPGASLGPSKSHPEATGHLCVGWSSRDPCGLLTPPSSFNKGCPLSFISAWVLLRVISCCILHHSALVLHLFPGFLLSGAAHCCALWTVLFNQIFSFCSFLLTVTSGKRQCLSQALS